MTGPQFLILLSGIWQIVANTAEPGVSRHLAQFVSLVLGGGGLVCAMFGLPA